MGDDVREAIRLGLREGWRDEHYSVDSLVDVLEDRLAPLLAHARAQALRDVADYIESTAHGVVGPVWLRQRADAEEATP